MKNEIIRFYNVPTEKIVVIQPKSQEWIGRILQIYNEATKDVGGYI
jgi:hypothetical protein